MVWKLSQTKTYHVSIDDKRTHFYNVQLCEVENVENWNSWKWVRNVFKRFLAVQLSSFDGKEDIKSFRLKKKFKHLKNFILNKTCFSDAETHFWQPKILKIS